MRITPGGLKVPADPSAAMVPAGWLRLPCRSIRRAAAIIEAARMLQEGGTCGWGCAEAKRIFTHAGMAYPAAWEHALERMFPD